jgi:hypothetical protein
MQSTAVWNLKPERWGSPFVLSRGARENRPVIRDNSRRGGGGGGGGSNSNSTTTTYYYYYY